jgi:hypothetical protein
MDDVQKCYSFMVSFNFIVSYFRQWNWQWIQNYPPGREIIRLSHFLC